MLTAVERRPGLRVGEPEVGAAVDHDRVVGQRLRDRGGLAVRQAEEHHVVPGEHLDGGLLQDPVGQRHQVRLEGAERLPRVGPGRDGPDLHVGMAEQQAQHLAAGVPARPGDRDSAFRHVHEYTLDCIFTQSGDRCGERRRGLARTRRTSCPVCPVRTGAKRRARRARGQPAVRPGGRLRTRSRPARPQVAGLGGLRLGQRPVRRPEAQRERQRLLALADRRRRCRRRRPAPTPAAARPPRGASGRTRLGRARSASSSNATSSLATG